MRRREILRFLPALAGFRSVRVQAAVPLPTPDWSRLLQKIAVTGGDYQGTYLTGPSGAIRWYYNNLTLRHFMPDLAPDVVKAYLNAYLRNSEILVDKVIHDYDPSGSNPGLLAPDSHDSYVATFLHLVADYVTTYGDRAWLHTNIRVIKALALENLVLPSSRNGNGFTMAIRGLTNPNAPKLCEKEEVGVKIKIVCPVYPVGFLMDQCEVYAGLKAFALCLRNFPADPRYPDSFADRLSDSADELGKLIHQKLFDTQLGRWKANDTIGNGSTDNKFYPTLACQIFPELYGVSSGDAAADQVRFDSGRRAFEATFHEWQTASLNQFPWLTIGYYYALRRKDYDGARTMVKTVFDRFMPGLDWGTNMTNFDLGFARAIIRLSGG